MSASIPGLKAFLRASKTQRHASTRFYASCSIFHFFSNSCQIPIIRNRSKKPNPGTIKILSKMILLRCSLRRLTIVVGLFVRRGAIESLRDTDNRRVSRRFDGYPRSHHFGRKGRYARVRPRSPSG